MAALAVACTTGVKGKGADTIQIRAARSQVLVATLTPAPSHTTSRVALDVLTNSLALTPALPPTASATPSSKLDTVAVADIPEATETPTALATATTSKTLTPAPTRTASATPTQTPTASGTPSASVTTTQTPTPTPTPTSTPAASPVSLSQYEGALLQLHNQARSDNGLQPFVADATLEQIARQRAQTMAQSGSFSHYNPDGTDLFDMMKALGYQYTDAAENIHYNFGYDDAQSVQVAMTAFMNSAPHRVNILKADLHRIGIGIAHASDGKVYYAVDFSN